MLLILIADAVSCQHASVEGCFCEASCQYHLVNDEYQYIDIPDPRINPFISSIVDKLLFANRSWILALLDAIQNIFTLKAMFDVHRTR